MIIINCRERACYPQTLRFCWTVARYVFKPLRGCQSTCVFTSSEQIIPRNAIIRNRVHSGKRCHTTYVLGYWFSVMKRDYRCLQQHGTRRTKRERKPCHNHGHQRHLRQQEAEPGLQRHSHRMKLERNVSCNTLQSAAPCECCCRSDHCNARPRECIC